MREGLLKGTTIREKFEFGWNRVIELGTFVYMLKAHLHGIFELSSESVSSAIRLCWNAVTLRDLT